MALRKTYIYMYVSPLFPVQHLLAGPNMFLFIPFTCVCLWAFTSALFALTYQLCTAHFHLLRNNGEGKRLA
jgi:hypothetical protein